jgi:hypothetical protein
MMHNSQVIKANSDLTPEHHQFFLYQLLRGMKYIHSGVLQFGVALLSKCLCSHVASPHQGH